METRSKNKRLDKVPSRLRAAVKTDFVKIRDRIKQGRKDSGLTQDALASLLDVEVTTIQSIEQGRARPSLELLLTLVKTLKIKIVLS